MDGVIDYNKNFKDLRWQLPPKSDSLFIQQLLKNWTPSTKYLLPVQNILVYFLRKNFFFSVRGHISVIRTCGVEEKYLMSDTAKANPLDEYNTVLQEYATEVYNCREEGCNGSPNLKISFLALLTVLAALIH